MLLIDKELVNVNEPGMFFFMTVILAILLVVAGVLSVIVGIYGILEVYRRDTK
ncbi:MAG: hypothetical protein JSW11_03070 [Candidatus Heimdallarchaeota archaeon]|nr:MAG: hypothetical protein JSW11_03070 [Candidatus Heimdallarchaeota archaeon]